MTTWHGYLLGGLLFLLAGLLVLSNLQPVWSSVATVVVVFGAAAAWITRGLIERRKARTGA
ncbi:hypothetical protein [Microbacterium hibisci]|uniref:hypothetical protein n=1 Tax=Microbacterium hibisci TaxID=2036000 RepID=UPI001940A5E2|nr:hypothetical protein [Microbacterium hibisci]